MNKIVIGIAAFALVFFISLLSAFFYTSEKIYGEEAPVRELASKKEEIPPSKRLDLNLTHDGRERIIVEVNTLLEKGYRQKRG